MTTFDILRQINNKRKKKGLETVPYQTFMINYRVITKFAPPEGKIGNSYIFNKKTARKIVLLLWDRPYRRIPRVDWFAWRRVA